MTPATPPCAYGDAPHDWERYGVGLAHRDGERCEVCIGCRELRSFRMTPDERAACGCADCDEHARR